MKRARAAMPSTPMLRAVASSSRTPRCASSSCCGRSDGSLCRTSSECPMRRDDGMRAIQTAAVLTLAWAIAAPAGAATKLSFLTSWKAQAEHGGYYMALANGYYAKCGDDVTIRQGGPGMDAKQLFAAGAVDLMMAPYTDDA